MSVKSVSDKEFGSQQSGKRVCRDELGLLLLCTSDSYSLNFRTEWGKPDPCMTDHRLQEKNASFYSSCANPCAAVHVD